MALNRKRDPEFEALMQQAVAEQKAIYPQLFEEPQPLSEELIEQLLRDEAELERIWDEFDREHPDHPRVWAAKILIEDRGDR
jgi:hypothetical protein